MEFIVVLITEFWVFLLVGLAVIMAAELIVWVNNKGVKRVG